MQGNHGGSRGQGRVAHLKREKNLPYQENKRNTYTDDIALASFLGFLELLDLYANGIDSRKEEIMVGKVFGNATTLRLTIHLMGLFTVTQSSSFLGDEKTFCSFCRLHQLTIPKLNCKISYYCSLFGLLLNAETI